MYRRQLDVPPPRIDDASLSTNQPGSRIAKIRATVTDDRRLAEIYALVSGPGGGSTRVTMHAKGGGSFEGAFVAPANHTTTPAVYKVVVYAVDSSGQQARASAGKLTVAPTVVAGPLTVSTRTLQFGAVRVGQRGLATVVLRNSGAPGTGAVDVRVSLSESGFRLLGSPQV